MTNGCLPSSRIIVFEAISSPLCPSVRGQTPAKYPFENLVGRESRATTCRFPAELRRPFPWTIAPSPLRIRSNCRTIFFTTHSWNEYRSTKEMDTWNSWRGFFHPFVDFSFHRGREFRFLSSMLLFCFCFVVILFLFFFFFLSFNRIVD